MGGYRLREELRQIIRRAKAGKCKDCKSFQPIYMMSFDHCRGTKSFNIGGSLVGVTKEQLTIELLKTDLVCVPCHRDREFLRMADDLAD